MTTTPDTMPYDRWARWSYEQLCLQQPHAGIRGLWRRGDQFFIECPDIDSLSTRDGAPLERWFDQHCRVVTSPVRLVREVPEGATPVPPRTVEDLVLLRGSPQTLRELNRDFRFLLPRDFSPVHIADPKGNIEITVYGELSPDDEEVLVRVYESQGLPPNWTIKISKEAPPAPAGFTRGRDKFELAPSHQLPAGTPRVVKHLVEDDEDFWIDNRVRVLGTVDAVDPAELLPKSWRAKESTCLVDASVSPPKNLRSYLGLYKRVCLVAPLASSYERQLAGLLVTEDELVGLAETGRVRFVFPHSIERYPERLLVALAERAPDSVVLSRRLAAASVLDVRRRWPILFPPFGPDERHLFLAALARFAETTGGPAGDGVKDILNLLTLAWSRGEFALHQRGAQVTSQFGVAGIVAEFLKRSHGRDFAIEAWSAGANVEWAGALSANLFPKSTDGYDESGHAELIATVYSGRGPIAVPVIDRGVQTVLNGVLAVDNDVPVLTFAKEFESGDIERLRDLVVRIASENVDDDYLGEAVSKFNAEVRRYENRPGRAWSLGIFSAISATSASAIPEEYAAVRPYVGIGLLALLLLTQQELAPKNKNLGRVLDSMQAALAGVQPGAVLVSRLRKQVGWMKSPK